MYNQFYYTEDKRVGEQMFFNEKDAYVEYNADLIRFKISPGTRNMDYIKKCGNSNFQLFSSKEHEKTASAEMYVGGASNEEAMTNVSKLVSECKDCVIRFGNSIYEYPAILSSYDTTEPEVENYYLVKIEFFIIRRLPLIQSTVLGSAIITNPGTQASGIRYEFTPNVSMNNMVFHQITLRDISAHITYVVDGIEGKVTANGMNYFSHTDLIEFPKIEPGENIVRISEDFPVKVSFYPVFL